jgi:hypothetical protein
MVFRRSECASVRFAVALSGEPYEGPAGADRRFALAVRRIAEEIQEARRVERRIAL